MRLIIIDAGGVSEAQFEELKAGWLADLGREGCKTVSDSSALLRAADSSLGYPNLAQLGLEEG